MKAALYARYSTDLQREASIADQFRSCERAAVAADLEVVGRYEDMAITAGTVERPGYQALLTAARSGAFKVIITEDVSRLWRNRAEFGARSAELEDLGIHLLTCVGDDTRRDGWGLVMGLKALLAEHMRRETAYRTRRAMEGLALAGRPTGSRRFGERPEEAVIVKQIFEWRVQGLTFRQVAEKLDAQLDGMAPMRGGKWQPSSVRAVVRNTRHMGRLQWGRREASGGARDSRHKRYLERPGGPLVDVPLPGDPLIPPAIWEAAQRPQKAKA